VGYSAITFRLLQNVKYYFCKRTRFTGVCEGAFLLLHIFDTFGDLLYVVTAPFYGWGLFCFLGLFWISPMVILLVSAFKMPKREYSRVERFYLWLGLNLDILHWWDTDE